MKKLEKMSAEERRDTLAQVGDDLQVVINFKPPIRTKGKSEKYILDKLKAAGPNIIPDEDEEDLAEETVHYMKELGLWPNGEQVVSEEAEEDDVEKAEVVEEEVEEEPEPEEGEEQEEENILAQDIESAKKIKELKDIARANDEFKSLRNRLSSYTSIKSLRSLMLKILAGEVEIKETDQEEKEQKPKTSSQKKRKQSDKKEKHKPEQVKVKYSRQDAVLDIVESKCSKFLSLTEIAEFSDELYMKKSDAVGVSNLNNMMNVVRHSVITLVRFGFLEEKDKKYRLNK